MCVTRGRTLRDLTYKPPSFVYVNACKTTPLEINFVYLDKEIYCVLMTCCILFVLFPIQYHLFYNVTFCVQIINFVNNMQKFKY